MQRQELLNEISFFTSQPKSNFYDNLFSNLNLDSIELYNNKTGRKGADNHAMISAFIVMKCEGFSQISDLHDYLSNNLKIAYYCGFNIMKNLPSYASFTRFIREFDNSILQKLMQNEVIQANELSIIDSSIVALDATPIKANVSNNNPKSFRRNKFSKSNPPTTDEDCSLGVQTASNQHNERKFDYYWGYKNHILVDCKSGLPICELTTGANVSDSTVAIEILEKTNSYLPLNQCSFLADKGYDVKAIYNHVKEVYDGECFIPLNVRNTKNPKKLPQGNIICDAGLAMHKDGKFHDRGYFRQKFCCPFKRTKSDNICPCNHKNWNNGKKNRGCTKYSTVPDDYRLSIIRDSISFKSIYRLRTEVERYNSRFKSLGCERAYTRNINSITNINTIAHISLLAIAIATVVCNINVSFRAFKSVMRIA